MKFISTQSNLNKGVSTAEKAIGKNFNLPILQNMLILCEENKPTVKFSSTDLELGIEVEIPGKIEKAGSITVPARLFSSFVRVLPQENIEVSETNKSILIKCDKYKSMIKGESSGDFPLIPSVKNGERVEIKSSDFILGINSVIHSVSSLDIKPEITGVFVQFSGKDACFASTDSFRLSEKKMGKVLKANSSQKIILPKKTCDLISRIFQYSDENLIFEIGENQISIENKPGNSSFTKTRMISRVIDGEYPDYEQIIPKTFITTLEISKEELVNHIRTAGLFSTKVNEVSLNINAEKQCVEVLSKDQDYGEHFSSISARVNGDGLKISFNYNYLLDGLQTVDSPLVSIRFNKESNPVLISSVENDGFRYIVMPIRTQI